MSREIFDRQSNREARWRAEQELVDRLVDRLEHPVDAGIKEAVIGLRVFGINTTASCEGHAERAVRAPWIDIGADLPEGIVQAFQNATKSGDEATADALWKQIKVLNLKEWQKAIPLLDEFYRGRVILYDMRLIIAPEAQGGRLMSQGAMLQSISAESVVRAHLSDYQGEMRAFAAFLKQKFVSI